MARTKKIKLGGWLRSWIVLSALWAMPMLYASVTSVRAAYERQHAPIPMVKSFSHCKSTDKGLKSDAFERDFGYLVGCEPEMIPDPNYSPMKESIAQIAATWLAATLAPPAALFFVGLCISWIISGFRQEIHPD